MADDFDIAVAYVLSDEGGNDNDPHDPGGRTSRGITQREYDAYRFQLDEIKRDVWIALDAEIREIYLQQYWQPICDRLPRAIDYLVFDMNVNMGPPEATLLLQRALGVKVDGHLGLVTLQAAQTYDTKRLITVVSDEKSAFYHSLKTFKYFGKGWLSRVDNVQARCFKMLAG